MALRRPRRIARVALALGSVVCALLLVEAALRLVETLDPNRLERLTDRPPPSDRPARLGDLIRLSDNPRLVYELKPGVTGRTTHAEVRINALGLRGEPPPSPRAPGDMRVLLLGDSVTYGWSVPTPLIYPSLLEGLLREAWPGRRVSVLNAGVPGYNAAMEAEALLARWAALEPDAVVWQFDANDVELPNFVRRRPSFWRLTDSALWRLLSARSLRMDLGQRREREGEAAVEQYRRDMPEAYRGLVGFEAVERAVMRVAEWSRRTDTPVVWFAYRDSFFQTDDPGDARRRERNARAAALARAAGFRVVDYADLARRALSFGRKLDADFQVTPRDYHPNEYHNATIAIALARAVVALEATPSSDIDPGAEMWEALKVALARAFGGRPAVTP